MDFRIQLAALASGNIAPAVFVKGDASNSLKVLQAGVGDAPIGVSGNWKHFPAGTQLDDTYHAVAGKPCAVFTTGSIIPLTYGATVTAYQALKPDTNGKGVPITSVFDIFGAIALEAGNAGEEHYVMVQTPFVSTGTLSASTVQTVTTSQTLTAAQSGSIFLANAADLTFTMPTPAQGLKYRIVSAAATATLQGGSVGTQLAPAGTEEFIGDGFTAAAGKGAINTHGTAIQGDQMEVACLDGTNWWITAVIGTWARHA